jgi:hypothetical protein
MNTQEIANDCLNEIELNIIKNNARLNMAVQDATFRMAVANAKQSERLLTIWSETELKKHGYNVAKIRQSINNIKQVCKELNINY